MGGAGNITGYDPDTFAGTIGVYAGMVRTPTFVEPLSNRHSIDAVNSYQAEMGNRTT